MGDMFTQYEIDTVKDLAMGQLESLCKGPLEEVGDLATLPVYMFDEEPEKVQELQAIVKRCDNQIFREAGLTVGEETDAKGNTNKEDRESSPEE